jgi:hypothetical protein
VNQFVQHEGPHADGGQFAQLGPHADARDGGHQNQLEMSVSSRRALVALACEFLSNNAG